LSDRSMNMFNRPVTRQPSEPTVNGQAPSTDQTKSKARAERPLAAAPSSAQQEGVVVVGRGTRLSGNISDCRKLEVHGVVEADVRTEELIVREGGGIRGAVEVKNAEIHGTFEGTLVVGEHLEVAPTGHVAAEVSYRTLSVASGATVHGMLKREEDKKEAFRSAAAEAKATVPDSQTVRRDDPAKAQKVQNGAQIHH